MSRVRTLLDPRPTKTDLSCHIALPRELEHRECDAIRVGLLIGGSIRWFKFVFLLQHRVAEIGIFLEVLSGPNSVSNQFSIITNRAHKLQSKHFGFTWITDNPYIFQIAQRKPICVMLRLEREQRMLQQCDRPEFGDALECLTALLVDRSQLLLRTTLCKQFMSNLKTMRSCDHRGTKRYAHRE